MENVSSVVYSIGAVFTVRGCITASVQCQHMMQQWAATLIFTALIHCCLVRSFKTF